MSCDLHTHSTFSDGTSTPEELVSAAQELGLTAVALCDHNDVDGLPRFLAAARGGRTAAVPGNGDKHGLRGHGAAYSGPVHT